MPTIPLHTGNTIMADTTQPVPEDLEDNNSGTQTDTQPEHWISRLRQLDRAWWLFIAIVAVVAVAIPGHLSGVMSDVAGNLAHTGVFILFAVLLIALLRATGAETIIGRAFQGNEFQMVFLASLVGGLAPFCSCEVVPFIAALLAMGTPLSAVMAFWLSSPLIDPPMFVITASALGWEFAVAKTIAAVSFGLIGGFSVMAMSRTALFANPLKDSGPTGCGSCCGSAQPFAGNVEWKFWSSSERSAVFRETALENFLFLIKWMALAYLLEALMVRFVPAEWIASTLGGGGVQPVALGALLGGPAYLNGYAAVPLVQGLVEQGMSQGAAMSFILAGSVTCIPAAVAVWALVKTRVFLSYIAIGVSASFVGGLLWGGFAT